MPYYAQPRLDGTYPELRLFLSLTVDEGGVKRLRVTTHWPLDTSVLSEELYSNLSAAEALDVIAATLTLSGADLDAGPGSVSAASDAAGSTPASGR